MTDPRKPIKTLDDGIERDEIRSFIHGLLLTVTSSGSKAIGCTGASFICISMAIWVEGLSEIDAKATSKMLSALAVLANPSSNDGQKRQAEDNRKAAVETLFHTLDLDMAATAGTS